MLIFRFTGQSPVLADGAWQFVDRSYYWQVVSLAPIVHGTDDFDYPGVELYGRAFFSSGRWLGFSGPRIDRWFRSPTVTQQHLGTLHLPFLFLVAQHHAKCPLGFVAQFFGASAAGRAVELLPFFRMALGPVAAGRSPAVDASCHGIPRCAARAQLGRLFEQGMQVLGHGDVSLAVRRFGFPLRARRAARARSKTLHNRDLHALAARRIGSARSRSSRPRCASGSDSRPNAENEKSLASRERPERSKASWNASAIYTNRYHKVRFVKRTEELF